jgi:hypothetical protein
VPAAARTAARSRRRAIPRAAPESSIGGGSSNSSPGEFIGLLIFAFIAWMVYRRYFKSPPNGGIARAMPISPTSPNSPLASEALGAILGAATAGRLGNSQGQAQMLPARPGLPAALATIRTQDSAFEIETFLQRAEMTFFLVKRGMQKNDAAAVRPFVNDAVFAVVSRSITRQRRTTGTCSWRASTCAPCTSSKRPAAIRAKPARAFRSRVPRQDAR